MTYVTITGIPLPSFASRRLPARIQRVWRRWPVLSYRSRANAVARALLVSHLPAVLVCQAVDHHRLPDVWRGGRLANLRPDAQRLCAGAGRAGAVPAVGGAGAGLRPYCRPLRPAPGGARVPGDRSAGGRDAGHRRADGTCQRAADLYLRGADRRDARVRNADAAGAAANAGAVRSAAARGGAVQFGRADRHHPRAGGGWVPLCGGCAGGVWHGGRPVPAGARAAGLPAHRARGADHHAGEPAIAVCRHRVHQGAAGGAGCHLAGSVCRAAGRRNSAAADLRARHPRHRGGGWACCARRRRWARLPWRSSWRTGHWTGTSDA